MKKKMKTSNKVLIISIIAVTLYTIADFALQYFTNIEVSPTLTTAWFAFWGSEIIALAAIKTSKVKHGYDNFNIEENE